MRCNALFKYIYTIRSGQCFNRLNEMNGKRIISAKTEKKAYPFK